MLIKPETIIFTIRKSVSWVKILFMDSIINVMKRYRIRDIESESEFQRAERNWRVLLLSVCREY